MAWTTPRTWVTGEIVTAALLNTHLRDNFNQTGAAKVTTLGDLVFANGANVMKRLAVGTFGQFLVGGGTPGWDNVLGSASSNGLLILKGTAPQIRWSETDATDPDDYWSITSDATRLKLKHWDNTANDLVVSLSLAAKDVILHTGKFGANEGAVVINSDESGSSEAATTTGATILSVTINNLQPAYVHGIWSARVVRIATGSSTDTIAFHPRDDGSTIDTVFSYAGDWAENNIPTNGDVGTIGGVWYKRFTGSDVSDWEMFVIASTNSIFTYSVDMMVTSIHYPT